MLRSPEYDFCLQPQRFVIYNRPCHDVRLRNPEIRYNHLNHDARLQIREICHPSEPKA